MAAVILAIGLVAVTQAMARTQQALRISENLAQASQIIQDKIVLSELELRDQKKLDGRQESGEEKMLGRKFYWQIITEPFLREAVAGVKYLNQVKVILVWKDGSSRENHRIFGTLFLDRTLETQR